MHRSHRTGAPDHAGHDPLAEMHRSLMQMQQSMMQGVNDPFFSDPFVARQDPFAQAPSSRRVPAASAEVRADARGRSQVQIEEVDDESPEGRTHTDAIIEEPDDDGYSHARRASHNTPAQAHPPRQAYAEEGRRQHVQHASPHMHHAAGRQQYQRPGAGASRHQMPSNNMAMSPFGGNPFSSMFDSMFGRMDGMFGSMLGMPSMGDMLSQMPQGSGTYYSSSSMYCSSGGPGGMTYEKTSSKRMGPGGVMEEQHTVRDGRTGEQKMTITRGVGEKQRTLERARINGQEHRNESLKGIYSPEEAARFDAEWRQRAASSLPPDLATMRRGSRGAPHAPYLDYQPRRA